MTPASYPGDLTSFLDQAGAHVLSMLTELLLLTNLRPGEGADTLYEACLLFLCQTLATTLSWCQQRATESKQLQLFGEPESREGSLPLLDASLTHASPVPCVQLRGV